jgi:large subunit ribosomal protein L25
VNERFEIFGANMATVSLSANPRNENGKGAARKLRAQGLMPAVIYRAGQAATSISLDPHALELAFHKTNNRNTLVEIGVDGSTFTCLVKATQRDPITSGLLHVDFFEVDNSEDVLVVVPVASTGKALGEVAGGQLRLIKRDLKVRCKPNVIPDTVLVDVSELNIGDFVRVSGVQAPAGTEIIAANDFNIITVIGKRGALEDEELEAEGADEAAGEEGTSEEAGE